jgi:LacI family transcriptional regulator
MGLEYDSELNDIPTGRVTMAEVAKAASVSMKSVSRVVNREANVSEKLRVKVQKAINDLGYVPDPAARSLAGARTRTIGILFDNPSPYYIMKIQAGAYQACREHGFHLLIENLDSAAGNVAEQMHEILLNLRVDGFVLTPPLTDNETVLDILDAKGIPYVRIAPVSFLHRSPSFSIDDGAAAAEIAKHFWDLGHRRFGMVTGPVDHGAAGTRRNGFLSALNSLGHEGDVPEAYGGFQFDVAINAGHILLTSPDKPTAIFAMNDDSAAGVMAAAAQLGMRVPQDVAIAGFDDSWIAKSVWPYLTTIYQPITEMSHQAATMLIERDAVKSAAGDCLLDYRFMVRASTWSPT